VPVQCLGPSRADLEDVPLVVEVRDGGPGVIG
jgi:hypothetical protein